MGTKKSKQISRGNVEQRSIKNIGLEDVQLNGSQRNRKKEGREARYCTLDLQDKLFDLFYKKVQ